MMISETIKTLLSLISPLKQYDTIEWAYVAGYKPLKVEPLACDMVTGQLHVTLLDY